MKRVLVGSLIKTSVWLAVMAVLTWLLVFFARATCEGPSGLTG